MTTSCSITRAVQSRVEEAECDKGNAKSGFGKKTAQMGQNRSLHLVPQNHPVVKCFKSIHIKVLMQILQDTEYKRFPGWLKCSRYFLSNLE